MPKFVSAIQRQKIVKEKKDLMSKKLYSGTWGLEKVRLQHLF